MATSWAAGIIVSEITSSYGFMCECQSTLKVNDEGGAEATGVGIAGSKYRWTQ
jgi:hypothetical protein